MTAGDVRWTSGVARTLRRPKVQSVASQCTYVVALFILNVVVVQAWGASERGDLATITIVATIAATVGGLGLTDVLVWAGGVKPETPDVGPRFRRSLIATALVGIVGAVVSMAILESSTWVFVPLWALSLHVFRASMSTRLAIADFPRFNLHRIALPGLTTLTVVIGAAAGAQVHAVVWALAGQVMAAVVFYDRGAPQLDLLGSLRRSARGEAVVARQSVMGNLAGLSLARVDVLIVATLLTSADAGRYAIALAVGDGAMVVSYGLMSHAMHEGARNKAVARRTLAASMGSTVLLSLLAAAALHLAAFDVLGPEFEDIAGTFLLLVPGIAAMGYLRLRYAGDLTGGFGGRATRSLLVAFVLLVVVDLILVPAYGINGAAIGSSIAYLVATVTLASWSPPRRAAP